MNPFTPVSQWLEKNNMTPDEKRRMRTALVHYATTHPVRSGIMSPYTFRFASMAMASLLVVLGGSAGLTTAANNSLPNDALYPVKIFIEEYRAKNQTTPDAVIAFETKRIETRFDEATKLAVAHELDDATASVLQSGIEHSRNAVKSAADQIQNQNPELALAASAKLETTFSSNGKILATIERGTNQSLGTIVLAAQVTTSKLATEKAKYEHIVAMKPNDTTKLAAESKLATLEKLLPTEIPAVEPEPAVATVTVDIATTIAVDSGVPDLRKIMPVEPEAPIVAVTATPTARELIASAKLKMVDGKYSEALVLLGQAEQLLNEKTLTTSLEETYNVKIVPEAGIEPASAR